MKNPERQIVERVAILAITKNGVQLGRTIKDSFGDWELYVPSKFNDGHPNTTWFEDSATQRIGELFGTHDGLVCIFSLGAVIRLIAPHLKDKKTDPAVLVIDDKANFVISVLSGHIGGANQLTQKLAQKLGATPVITTAADVNKTIAVDLVGRQFGWTIENDDTVTATSAHMVNGEAIGIYQDSGETNWYDTLPKNVKVYDDWNEMKDANLKAYLIISDRMIQSDMLDRSVLYRPKSLIVGVGLHGDTTKEKIHDGIKKTFEKYGISTKCIAGLVSIKKPRDVEGLKELATHLDVPIQYVDREELALVKAPNPSDTVQSFEGTASVAEAAAILVSKGSLIVEKQKFPPDLTIAVARRKK